VYYRIDWDALNGLPPAARRKVLAHISTRAQRASGAERVRIVHTEIELQGGGHGSQKAAAEALGLKQTRTNQIAKESPMTVTISTVEPAELHHQYPGQNEPQPAYVEVDLENQHISADYDPEIGNATPARVAHGIARRYPIPALTSTAANKLLEQIRPLAERMVADWDEHWDGSNHKGVLGDDARAAEEKIQELTGDPRDWGDHWDSSDVVTVWDTDGAIAGDEAEEYGITADTTDDRLEEIEAEILETLKGISDSNEVVLEGVWEHLVQMRDDADEDDE
jgi:hypothetical protein